MSTNYDYSVSTYFEGTEPNTTQLYQEIINDVTILKKLSDVQKNPQDTTGKIRVTFTKALTDVEKTSLDSLVVNHNPHVFSGETCVRIWDKKSTGTNGGTATPFRWIVRDLTDISDDNNEHISLASNQITLFPGSYTIKVTAPASNVQTHQIRLRNITDKVTEVSGTSEGSYNKNNTKSELLKYINISKTKVFEVHHCIQGTTGDADLGLAASLGEEIYTVVTINIL